MIYVTIFNNGTSLPVSDSVEVETDPSAYFGEPDIEVSPDFKMWNCDNLRIVLTSVSF